MARSSGVNREIGALVPEMAERIRTLVAEMEAVGHPIVVVETLRSYARQDALYAQGRTVSGQKVTNARGGQSWHNFGRAVDLAFKDGPKGVTWMGPWDLLGRHGELLGLQWGVVSSKTGKRSDLGHFEFRGGLTLRQARQAWEAPKKGEG